MNVVNAPVSGTVLQIHTVQGKVHGVNVPVPRSNEGMLWRIWSLEHQMWWKADWDGYTLDFLESGIYTYKQAKQILGAANVTKQKEIAVPAACWDGGDEMTIY